MHGQVVIPPSPQGLPIVGVGNRVDAPNVLLARSVLENYDHAEEI